ncbi:MAG: hypothetical protein QMD80_03260 [archaeon]|nr:hypothetical protein [archaeon]
MPAGSVVVVRTGTVNLPMGSGPFREGWLSANGIIARGISKAPLLGAFIRGMNMKRSELC